MYDDARNAPKTAEDYEKNAYGSTCLTAAEARRILSAHKVPGRSKLDADAARDMASEQWPDEVRVVREAKVVRYRWSVAHGLGVSYTGASRQWRAGVEPLPSPGSRGSYASAEDVAKVYAAGAAYRAESHAVRIRISFDDIDDASARKRGLRAHSGNVRVHAGERLRPATRRPRALLRGDRPESSRAC